MISKSLRFGSLRLGTSAPQLSSPAGPPPPQTPALQALVPPPVYAWNRCDLADWAFLRQNGAFSGPKVCDFGPVRATFSVKHVGPLFVRTMICLHAWFSEVFFAFFTTSVPKMCTVCKPMPMCQFAGLFNENAVRNHRKPACFDEKTLRSAVGTPICQIVPVSRAYFPLHGDSHRSR